MSDSSSPTSPSDHASAALVSLATILSPTPVPPSADPLHDPVVGTAISSRLRHPDSGVGDDNLCRWLYDAFQSSDPRLHLSVLRFIPTLTGVYLSRAISRKPLAGFEAVLLALYAHETKARGGQPQIVNIPNMDHPSLYHEGAKSTPAKSKAIDLHIAVMSPTLEPHGNVRSTKRARIVGVALELYYSRIVEMPVSSKVEFCEFCVAWAGQEGCDEENRVMEEGGSGTGGEGSGERWGRVPLPWELFQPVVRIVGHCLLGGTLAEEELRKGALKAATCLYARALHDMMPQAVLATRGLLRLWTMAKEEVGAMADLGDPEPISTLSL